MTGGTVVTLRNRLRHREISCVASDQDRPRMDGHGGEVATLDLLARRPDRGAAFDLIDRAAADAGVRLSNAEFVALAQAVHVRPDGMVAETQQLMRMLRDRVANPTRRDPADLVLDVFMGKEPEP